MAEFPLDPQLAKMLVTSPDFRSTLLLLLMGLCVPGAQCACGRWGWGGTKGEGHPLTDSFTHPQCLRRTVPLCAY